MKKDAFGDITEAEIHYDFDQAPFLHFLSAKEYTPGAGLTFGLGMNFSFLPCIRLINE